MNNKSETLEGNGKKNFVEKIQGYFFSLLVG